MVIVVLIWMFIYIYIYSHIIYIHKYFIIHIYIYIVYSDIHSSYHSQIKSFFFMLSTPVFKPTWLRQVKVISLHPSTVSHCKQGPDKPLDESNCGDTPTIKKQWSMAVLERSKRQSEWFTRMQIVWRSRIEALECGHGRWIWMWFQLWFMDVDVYGLFPFGVMIPNQPSSIFMYC